MRGLFMQVRRRTPAAGCLATQGVGVKRLTMPSQETSAVSYTDRMSHVRFLRGPAQTLFCRDGSLRFETSFSSRPIAMKFGIRALLVFVAVVAIATVSIRTVTSLVDPFDNLSFNSTEWKQAKDREVKARMSRDAILNGLEAGMTREEVQHLLGEPDDIITANHDSGGSVLLGVETFSYYIGSWSMYGFDDAFVYIHFDRDGRVISARIDGY